MADLTGTPTDRAAGVRQMYRLVSRFEPSWKPYVLSAITAAGTTIFEAATLILLTLSAATIAKSDTGRNTLAGISLSQGEMLALAGIFLTGRLLMTWTYAQITSRLASRTLLEARRQILDAYTGVGWEVQARQQQGIIHDILANRADVVGISAILLTGVLVGMINISVLAATALALEPLAVLALIVVGGLMASVLRPLNRHTRKLARALLVANEGFINAITDLTHNARDLTAYRVGHRFRDRVLDQQREVIDLYRRRARLMNFTPQAYQTVGLALAVAGLAVASTSKGGSAASLGAVVLLLLRGVSYAQMLINSSQMLSERLPMVSSLVELLDDLNAQRAPEGTVVPSGPVDLSLKDLSYAYDHTGPVIDHLDLNIPSGQRLGVVGPSGSGKSTMLQILAGLRTPTAGRYEVAGTLHEDLDPSWWGNRLALVSQDAKMLTDTVANNIAIYRDLDREAVEQGATKAQLADEVAALGGYDVDLSREGRSLSGGQLQRLSIARALAGDPAVLLLDEPTSALDVGTEARLQRVLADIGRGTTMVIVAHRLATVAACDRIIVLEKGRIIADGPPDIVLERFGAEALAQWELVEEDRPDAIASGAPDQEDADDRSPSAGR